MATSPSPGNLYYWCAVYDSYDTLGVFHEENVFCRTGGRVTPLGERMIWGETSWRGFTTQQDTVPPLWNKKSQVRNKLLIWKKK